MAETENDMEIGLRKHRCKLGKRCPLPLGISSTDQYVFASLSTPTLITGSITSAILASAPETVNFALTPAVI